MKRICLILLVALLFIYVGDIFAQNVEFIGQCDTPGSASDVFVQGDYAYIADRNSGLQIIKVSNPQTPSLAGGYDTPGIAIKLFVQGDYAYIADDDGGLQIINIYNPQEPVWVGSYEDCHDTWDVFVSGDYAYVGGREPDLTIIDISDPRIPFLVGSYPHGYIKRGVYIRDDFAYLVDYYSGLYIIDVADPENPAFAAWHGTGGYGNHDIFVYDDYAYIANGSFGLQIIDISDPYEPFWVSGFDTPGRSKGIFVQGDYTYESDGDSGLYIFDTVSPSYPIIAGRYDTPGYASSVFAINGYIYLADGYEGLIILRFLGPMLGSIEGSVTDAETEEPLEGVFLDVISTRFSDTTDVDGEYFLDSLYNFTYDIFFTHHDYFDTTIYDVQVEAGDTTILSVSLQHRLETDVGVSTIVSPPELMVNEAFYNLQSEVTNYGTETQVFDVMLDAYISRVPDIYLSDTVEAVELTSASVDTVQFADSLFTLPDTTYNILSYTNLIGDQDSDNNGTMKTCYSRNGVSVWYGSIECTPVNAFPGSRVYIDAYILTPGDVYLANLHLCLGSLDEYVDSLLNQEEGSFHGVILEWDDYSFLVPEGSPPNPEEWSSQSFAGWSDIGGAPNPWLHYEMPTKILTFVVKTVNNPSLVGDTIQCFGSGVNSILGRAFADDTMGIYRYPIKEYFSPLYFTNPPSECEYIPGNINGDGDVMGRDITYGVRYLKGSGNPPPDSCFNNYTYDWLYSAGDVNGDCLFNGSDITYLVAYFKGYNPEILWCPWTPPANPPLLKR